MKLTIKQLKRLIKEQLEESARDPSLLDAEALKELVRDYALDFDKPHRAGTASPINQIEDVIDNLYFHIQDLEQRLDGCERRLETAERYEADY